MTSLGVKVPLKVPSAANLREHWAVKAKRVQRQRAAALLHVKNAINGRLGFDPEFVGEVHLVRVAPRPIRDDDNLRAALKAVRDGVADALGRDDGDPGLVWRYGQERAGRELAVQVVLVWPDPEPEAES